jgi:flagellar protein FlbT
MALRLSLKPNERVIISGAAIRNGETRAELLIENKVPVLREPDIMSPAAARTPCQRIYLALQLMYVDPEQAPKHRTMLRALVADVVVAAPSCAELVERIEASVANGYLYRALKDARRLMDHERELMSSAQ